MPFGDGTGPFGQGPMTGRGAGYCAGYDRPGFANPCGGRGRGRGLGYGHGFGRGRGRGMGYGRGWGWRAVPPAYYPPVVAPEPISKEQEAEYLRNNMQALQDELNQMQARLDELEKE